MFRHRSERGITLVEVLIAVLVMTTGMLALGRLIPAATRGQHSDKMLTQANAYAQQKVESLQTLTWSDLLLADGRHPPGIASDSLGLTGAWQRHHEVTTLAARQPEESHRDRRLELPGPALGHGHDLPDALTTCSTSRLRAQAGRSPRVRPEASR
jgi:type II secretory pathway pseudopilin PulG